MAPQGMVVYIYRLELMRRMVMGCAGTDRGAYYSKGVSTTA